MRPESDEDNAGITSVDAVLPKDMARRAERTGVEKAEQDALALLALAMLAGAFIAFGAMFAAVVSGAPGGIMPDGLGRFLGGLAFCLSYVLAIIGGAELFTTNNMMVMAWAHGRLSTWHLCRAWSIVFVGNFVGVVATAGLQVLGGLHMEAGGAAGANLLASAAHLQGLSMLEALILGLLGNALLCLGVWLTYSARTTTDRILAMVPPVAAFYAMGLEHAIAVMYYLPAAALIEWFALPEFWDLAGAAPPGIGAVDFFRVLLPVTVGNIIGGGVLVAMVYWFIYLRPIR